MKIRLVLLLPFLYTLICVTFAVINPGLACLCICARPFASFTAARSRGGLLKIKKPQKAIGRPTRALTKIYRISFRLSLSPPPTWIMHAAADQTFAVGTSLRRRIYIFPALESQGKHTRWKFLENAFSLLPLFAPVSVIPRPGIDHRRCRRWSGTKKFTPRRNT